MVSIPEASRNKTLCLGDPRLSATAACSAGFMLRNEEDEIGYTKLGPDSTTENTLTSVSQSSNRPLKQKSAYFAMASSWITQTLVDQAWVKSSLMMRHTSPPFS